VLALVFFILISLFIYRTPLLNNDPHYMVNSRDLEVPLTLNNLIDEYYPMWSNVLSATDYVTVMQLPVIAIFELAKIVGWTSTTAVEVVMVTATALSGFFGYIVAFYFLSREFGVSKKTVLASLLAGLFIVVNPQWAADPRHFARKMADAFVPLMFLLFWIGFRDKKLWPILGATIVMIGAASTPRNVVMSAILASFLALYSFVADVLSRKPSVKELFKSLITRIGLLLVAGVFGFLSVARLFFPLLIRTSSGAFPSPYLISVESAQYSTSFATLINSIRDDVYPRHHPYYNPPIFLQTPTAQQAVFVLSLFVFVAAISVAFLGPRSKDTAVLLILLVFWTIFSTGVNAYGFPLVSNLYYWLILRAPLHYYYFWAFRKPIEFWPLTILFASVLLGYFSVKLMNYMGGLSGPRLPKKRVLLGGFVLILLIFSIALPSWPMFTGNFNGVLQPERIPDPYFTINQWLHEQPGDFKVLWLPPYTAENVSWMQSQVPHMYDALYLRSFDELSSSQPTYAIWNPPVTETPVISYLMNLVSLNYCCSFDIAQSNRTERFGHLLSQLNIRYVIVDAAIQPVLAARLLDYLSSQQDLRLVHQDGFMYAFENLSNLSGHIYSTSKNVLVDGGREVETTLSDIQAFDPTRTSLMFLDEAGAWDESVFDSSDTIIMHDWRNLLPIVAPSAIVPLIQFSSHQDFHSFWGQAMASEIKYGRWMPVLAAQHISNWDFDYGLGWVFTVKAGNTLSFPVRIPSNGEYAILLRYLPSQAGGEFRLLIDGLDFSSVHTISNATRQLLVNLGTLELSSGTHSFALQNIAGFNAINFLMIVPTGKIDEYKKEISGLLATKEQIFLELPGLDFQFLNATVTSRFGFNALNGYALTFGEDGAAWTYLEPMKSGEYQIAIRTPEPLQGGLLVQIGNYSFRLDVSSGGFTYSPVFHLEQKRYVVNISRAWGRPSFDSMFLYNSIGNDSKIETLLSVNDSPAPAINYDKIDPTRYVVEVNATKPFWLFLAESYDPYWVAYINNRPIPSVLSYQSINGFPIDSTGELRITLQYTQQSLFNYGVYTLIASLALSLILIFWDLRRLKHLKAAQSSAYPP
jgi:hypothetical protein